MDHGDEVEMIVQNVEYTHHCCKADHVREYSSQRQYCHHPLISREKRIFRKINYLTIHIFHGIHFLFLKKRVVSILVRYQYCRALISSQVTSVEVSACQANCLISPIVCNLQTYTLRDKKIQANRIDPTKRSFLRISLQSTADDTNKFNFGDKFTTISRKPLFNTVKKETSKSIDKDNNSNNKIALEIPLGEHFRLVKKT